MIGLVFLGPIATNILTSLGVGLTAGISVTAGVKAVSRLDELLFNEKDLEMMREKAKIIKDSNIKTHKVEISINEDLQQVIDTIKDLTTDEITDSIIKEENEENKKPELNILPKENKNNKNKKKS